MSKNKLSDMLLNLAAYAEENEIEDINALLKGINEEQALKEQIEIKRKFVELIKKTNEEPNYCIFIAKNEFNSYDIWLVFNANSLTTHFHTMEIIDALKQFRKKAYVVENINIENIRKFILAFYIYNRTKKSSIQNGDQKDLVYSNQNNTPLFKRTQVVPSKYMDNKSYVYYDYDVIPEYYLSGIDYNCFRNTETFEDVLELVYENKYVGSELKLIK